LTVAFFRPREATIGYPEMQRIGLSYFRLKAEIMTTTAGPEIISCCAVSLADLTEQMILREGAWVILSVGFRATVVQKVFPALTDAFMGWSSATEIISNAGRCCQAATLVFRNRPKVMAVVALADRLACRGKAWFAENMCDGRAVLGLPMFGAVTTAHFQMNLGVRRGKPDRHLRRLADLWGFRDADELCAALVSYTGDDVRMVDRILWHSRAGATLPVS
jgi:hypothetical protein